MICVCVSWGSKSRLAAEPSGQMRDEKLYAVVARSTFRSQTCKKLTVSDHFWKLRWWKRVRCCGAKHISKSKCAKHTRFGALLEVEMSKKCTPLWHEARFQVKMLKAPHVRTTLGRSDVVSRALAGMGHLKRICKDAFSVAGAVQETCASEMLGGPGGGFQRGAAFWSIRSSVLGRWFCVTSAAFRRHNTLETWTGKVAKRIGTRPSALRSTFHYWRKSRRIASFLMLPTQKLRRSRRISSFLTLSISKVEEVSQNGFDFQTCRKTGRQTDRQIDR